MRPVIVFDGVCNLCNASVDFILRRDPDRRFLFASNQSAPAASCWSRMASIRPT